MEIPFTEIPPTSTASWNTCAELARKIQHTRTKLQVWESTLDQCTDLMDQYVVLYVVNKQTNYLGRPYDDPDRCRHVVLSIHTTEDVAIAACPPPHYGIQMHTIYSVTKHTTCEILGEVSVAQILYSLRRMHNK